MPTTIYEHAAAIRGGDYKSPMLAINDTIEGLVHCGLIAREHETNLSPETRALDAIGVQVERELRNRKEMVMACCDRLTLIDMQLQDAKAKGYRVPPELEELPREMSIRERLEAAVMPEQKQAREKLHLADV